MESSVSSPDADHVVTHLQMWPTDSSCSRRSK